MEVFLTPPPPPSPDLHLRSHLGPVLAGLHQHVACVAVATVQHEAAVRCTVAPHDRHIGAEGLEQDHAIRADLWWIKCEHPYKCEYVDMCEHRVGGVGMSVEGAAETACSTIII